MHIEASLNQHNHIKEERDKYNTGIQKIKPGVKIFFPTFW